MDIKALQFRYTGWLREVTTLVFQKPTGEAVQFLSPKRGNSAYENRVKRRLGYVDAVFDAYRGGNGYTPFLFISATLAQDNTLEYEWENIGIKFNLFMMKLKRILGIDIEVLRCWESQQNGYPHIHALIKTSHLFKYFIQIKGKKRVYRIDSDILVNMIKDCWGKVTQRSWNPDKRVISRWGFLDVQTFINGNYAVAYCLKYITKMSLADDPNPKSTLNYALQWYFHKRAFSISKSLRRKCDLIRQTLLNSNFSPSLPYIFLGINTVNGFIPKDRFHKPIRYSKYTALTASDASEYRYKWYSERIRIESILSRNYAIMQKFKPDIRYFLNSV